MSAIGIEEAAAICSVHLDRFLGGHGPLRNHLRCDGVFLHAAISVLRFDNLRLQQVSVGVGMQVLHHSLGHQEERGDQAEGK